MDIELVQKLIAEADLKGTAKYRMYLLRKLDNAYDLLLNGKEIAKFIVTGYEQGFLEINQAKSPYQIKTVASLQAYLTGKH